MSHIFHISPVYDLLLRGTSETPVGLYHLHMATAAQLTRLHYRPGMLKTVKARLKVLADHGYVQADSIPTKTLRKPYYYMLAHKGMQYLASIGVEVQRTENGADRHYLFIDHTLELNDILVTSTLIQRANPQYCLYGFLHERTLKRYPCKVSWEENNVTQTYTIIPDAFLDFRMALADGRQRRLPILLEHDRGTEGREHFKRRIRAYITLLKTGAYQQFFGVKAITIAFTTLTGSHRLQQMAEWTHQELVASGEPKQLGIIFCFKDMVSPLEAGQLWFTNTWITPYAEDKPVALLTNA